VVGFSVNGDRTQLSRLEVFGFSVNGDRTQLSRLEVVGFSVNGDRTPVSRLADGCTLIVAGGCGTRGWLRQPLRQSSPLIRHDLRLKRRLVRSCSFGARSELDSNFYCPE
jgi:hypothetical protein